MNTELSKDQYDAYEAICSGILLLRWAANMFGTNNVYLCPPKFDLVLIAIGVQFLLFFIFLGPQDYGNMVIL